MRTALLVTAAMALLQIAGSAAAADMPVSGPWKTPSPVFTWTSCYFGAHAGSGWAWKDMTDPVQLAQDSIIGPGTTVGVTTTTVRPFGAVIGGQLGCDYQFSPDWLVGIEGAASGSTMKGSATVGLPAGFPGDQALVGARTDFLPSVTGRVGYTMGRLLFYGRTGVAWAGDKFTETGSLTGVGFGFEGLNLRTGWTGGAGVEWVFSRNWSAGLEYDYYWFGNGTVMMSDANNGFTGLVDVKQSVQVLKAVVNFHVWSTGW